MGFKFYPNNPIAENDEYVSTWISDGDSIVRMKVSKFALGELSGEPTPQLANFKKVLKDNCDQITIVAENKIAVGEIEDKQLVINQEKFDVVILRSSDLGNLID